MFPWLTELCTGISWSKLGRNSRHVQVTKSICTGPYSLIKLRASFWPEYLHFLLQIQRCVRRNDSQHRFGYTHWLPLRPDITRPRTAQWFLSHKYLKDYSHTVRGFPLRPHLIAGFPGTSRRSPGNIWTHISTSVENDTPRVALRFHRGAIRTRPLFDTAGCPCAMTPKPWSVT